MQVFVAMIAEKPYYIGLSEAEVKIQTVRKWFDIRSSFEKFNERALFEYLQNSGAVELKSGVINIEKTELA